jgi:hypothetical protein
MNGSPPVPSANQVIGGFKEYVAYIILFFCFNQQFNLVWGSVLASSSFSPFREEESTYPA